MSDLGDLKPVYLIHGSEELLLERAVARLRERLARVADLDFNFDHFDGAQASADEIVAAANTLPFMSERRLVVVRDVDKMPAEEQQRLAEYVKDPAEHTCLVLVGVKLAKNSRLYKAVAALGGVSEYAAPKRSEYPAKVVGLFEEKGREVGIDAAETLVEAVGRDLRRLATEIDKIVAFAGETTTLTRQDVEAVLSTVAPASIFDFLEAMGMRDARRAMRLLSDLLAQGEALLGVHAMAVRHVRQLASVRALTDRGLSCGEVAGAMGLADWQVRKLAPQAARHDQAGSSGALRSAAAAEAEMKTNRDARLAFERWVLEVCGEST
ncbi:MAG: DNA polymerase III subunit delta [Coriobacteriia bacterium]|nr:DNA polymerase III subunit delta [Coriobacteriia bacterium]